MSASRKRDLFAAAIGVVVLIIDQLTKFWIVQYFGVALGRPAIPILGQFLTLLYVQNTGVAFSMFSGPNFKFLLIFVALVVVLYLYWRFRETTSLWLRLGFGLVLGGAVGNLLDRFTRGYVVDFIYFQIPPKFQFAVFNLADSAITIGVIVLAIALYQLGTFTSAPNESSSMTTAASDPSKRSARMNDNA